MLCELTWTTCKLDVNIDTTNERGKRGKDLYYYVYVSAIVLARRNPIRTGVGLFRH